MLFLNLWTNTNQKKKSRNGVNLGWRKATGTQEEVNDHGPNHCCHEGGAYEECISVLEGCAGCEFKYEIVVDPCTLPHEQVASIHKQMQA